jgi:hypothetical protein
MLNKKELDLLEKFKVDLEELRNNVVEIDVSEHDELDPEEIVQMVSGDIIETTEDFLLFKKIFEKMLESVKEEYQSFECFYDEESANAIIISRPEMEVLKRSNNTKERTITPL